MSDVRLSSGVLAGDSTAETTPFASGGASRFKEGRAHSQLSGKDAHAELVNVEGGRVGTSRRGSNVPHPSSRYIIKLPSVSRRSVQRPAGSMELVRGHEATMGMQINTEEGLQAGPRVSSPGAETTATDEQLRSIVLEVAR